MAFAAGHLRNPPGTTAADEAHRPGRSNPRSQGAGDGGRCGLRPHEADVPAATRSAPSALPGASPTGLLQPAVRHGSIAPPRR
ncbi:MAG: hypothetical protein MZW92_57425 [Comamonadaceae bacterium]|nr:hypothetical protein [Comamonadaceae bacterium]